MNRLIQIWNHGSITSVFFRLYTSSVLILFFSTILQCPLNAQPEVMAWGNLTGIRMEGQLMEFETSLRVVEKGWLHFNATGKERQQPKYDREGLKQTVNTGIRGIRFLEMIEECDKGCAVVTVKTTAEKDTLLEGVFFCIDLPGKYFANAAVRFINASPDGRSKILLSDITPGDNSKPIKITSKGMVIQSEKRQLEINFNASVAVFLRKESESTQVYIELLGQKIKKGQETQKTFTIKATGVIDNSTVEIVLDVTNPGRKFEGLGGNFRLQNPKTDPQVIQYCLDNLRVAWGRVEMPWTFWHPDENTSPIEAAIGGNLNPRVHAAMEMAQRLARKGMPVIVSDWEAPRWAILGDPRDAFRLRSKGIRGYQLNPEKTEKIYRSIGDYLVFMKQRYGVEAAMFSFNESDLGINVRHTGKEYAEFIKGLGAHLASRGLATKLLLGDNSDATTFDFIIPAMNDPETHKYIGAVSFHSWRGCTDETLSILQWQLTADYSVLTGDGVFRTEGPLRPTQRFWNLKQLASTPEDAFSIPLNCNMEGINCAAFGNIARGEYAVHIVNNGAECRALVKGIPEGISTLEIFVTNDKKGMEKTGEVNVVNGTAEFMLLPAGFTTLISRK